jgi:hypothetical protein
MTMMSPERSKIGVGATSRVRPPTRKIAAFPRLVMGGKLVKVVEEGEEGEAHEIETRGEVAQISERST